MFISIIKRFLNFTIRVPDIKITLQKQTIKNFSLNVNMDRIIIFSSSKNKLLWFKE